MHLRSPICRNDRSILSRPVESCGHLSCSYITCKVPLLRLPAPLLPLPLLPLPLIPLPFLPSTPAASSPSPGIRAAAQCKWVSLQPSLPLSAVPLHYSSRYCRSHLVGHTLKVVQATTQGCKRRAKDRVRKRHVAGGAAGGSGGRGGTGGQVW